MKSLLNSTALRQAPEAGSGTTSTQDEPERKAIANRDWTLADGTVAKEEHEAVGMRYTYKADGKSFEWSPVTDDPATRMLAIFGGLTLAGNVTNTWKTKSNDYVSPIDAIVDRWNLLKTGQWIDRSEGARIDRDVLAESITQLAIEAGKIDGNDAAAVGTYKAEKRQKLEDDATYLRDVRKVPAVNAKYAELVGATVKSLDDVL